MILHFFVYMSYSWWPCYVSWYHLFIFRMSFLFEKFLCNWLYKWEPNSRQHTRSHSRKYNLWQNKRHKTKTHSIFCEGPHSNSVAVKLHETRPRICVRPWTPKSSFCYIFFWSSCWRTVNPSPLLTQKGLGIPLSLKSRRTFLKNLRAPCPSTGVWRDISNLYHFLFTSSFHSWWPSLHILFWCRQTLFYTKPFRVERQIHSHEAAEKQSWLWFHSRWRGWTWRVSANQELGPRWSCRPGWQDGNRYETQLGPVWSGPEGSWFLELVIVL